MQLSTDIFTLFDKDWALLTAGTMEHYNAMTVSWGSLGTLWNKPAATVYVKPIRYTHAFMEESEYFTLSFFPKGYKKDLLLLGTKSGRDGDKLALTSLTPEALPNAVRYKEAELTLLCRKMYHAEMDKSAMPPEEIRDYYESEAPHTIYIGEVVEIIKK